MIRQIHGRLRDGLLGKSSANSVGFKPSGNLNAQTVIDAIGNPSAMSMTMRRTPNSQPQKGTERLASRNEQPNLPVFHLGEEIARISGCLSLQSFWKAGSERKGSQIGSSLKSAGAISTTMSSTHQKWEELRRDLNEQPAQNLPASRLGREVA